MTSRVRGGAIVAALAVVAAGCGGSHSDGAAASKRLDGLFRIAPGLCESAQAAPTGSYLEVLSAARGHTVRNPQGGCTNPSYTLLRPGTDGGFVMGEFQDAAGALFDSDGDSRAGRIVAPVPFGKKALGFATSDLDQQDAPRGAPAFPRPAAIVSGTTLHVDLRSLVVSYNGRPDSTCAQTYGAGCWQLGSENASGTYDAASGHYEIEWLSGRSFTAKGDSVEVHIEGTFVPRTQASASNASLRSLQATRGVIEALPGALSEVPVAAAAAAGIEVAEAHEALARIGAVGPLVEAIDGKSLAVSALVDADRAVLAGDQLNDPASLPAALTALQAIEGDVVPAVRAVALQHGHRVSAAAVLTAIEHDPDTASLGQLLAGWSQIYGALVLVEQAATSPA